MNLIRASASHNLQLENQAKLSDERLSASQQTAAKFRTVFRDFSKETAKYAEATTDLADTLTEFGGNEEVNCTLKTSLEGISRCLTSSAQGRSNSTMFLVDEVLVSFNEFKAVCKNHRISIKNICSSKDGESANRRRSLIRKFSQDVPNNRDQPNTSAYMQSALENQALEFEKKKLVVFKSLLQDLVKAEMFFHAQAVENLSKALSILTSFNIDDDFANFKKALLETKRPQKIIRPSNFLVLRHPQANDKMAFLDDESLRRINDKQSSERSSLATVPSDVLCSEEDTSGRQSDVGQKRIPQTQPKFVTDRKK